MLPELGCPIRTSPDQRLLCGSPGLIATCYVLHRLLAPRHPPFALSSLITKITIYDGHSANCNLHALISMCSCQRTFPALPARGFWPLSAASRQMISKKVVGVTGFEPVTLRLSSACSNQLSYTPPPSRLRASARQARELAAKRRSPVGRRTGLPGRGSLRAKAGGAEEIRTPDL